MTPGRSRWMLVALALVGAAALAFAVGSPDHASWWTAGDVLSVGPGGSSTCFGGECSRHELLWLGGDALFRKAALGTLAAALIGAVALVALAAALASKRRGTLIAGAVLTATLTAAVAGGVFVATFPGVDAIGPGHQAALGIGLIVFAIGLALAVLVSVLVLRRQPDA